MPHHLRIIVLFSCSVDKKIVNPLDSPTKTLVIGDHAVSMASIVAVFERFGPESGIRFADVQPTRNRMNVPPIERMTSRVRDAQACAVPWCECDLPPPSAPHPADRAQADGE